MYTLITQPLKLLIPNHLVSAPHSSRLRLPLMQRRAGVLGRCTRVFRSNHHISGFFFPQSNMKYLSQR